MPADPWAEKAMLDWCLGGASPTRPASWFLELARGSPTSVSGSGFVSPSFVSTRLPVTFAAAGTPATSGTATNVSAVTFSATVALTAAASKAVGFNVWNASSGGTRLFYGQLSASSTMASGDTLAFAAGSLVITIT